MNIDLSTITEDEALGMFHDMRDHFGWAGTIFTRLDVEDAYLAFSEEEEGDPVQDNTLDQVWGSVSSSREWTRTIPDRLCEIGNWIIDDLMVRRVAASEGASE